VVKCPICGRELEYVITDTWLNPVIFYCRNCGKYDLTKLRDRLRLKLKRAWRRIRKTFNPTHP